MPPQPAVKGTGKGKSAYLGPPLPPPPARTNLQACEPAQPPPHLTAPAEAPRLRIGNNQRLPSAKGTLWEGLDPWGGDTGMGGQGLAINFDRLREQWEEPSAPATVAVTRTAAAHRTTILPAEVQQKIDIVRKATKLIPERVLHALTEDFQAISPEQARALANDVSPHVAEASGALQAMVHERGVDALGQAEALLWTIQSTPHGTLGVSLLHAHHWMDEDVAWAESQAGAAEAVVERLRTSTPVRALLQAILVVRNVMSQQESPAFLLESLGSRLASERLRRPPQTMINPATGMPSPGGETEARVRENHPTNLRLVAEILLDTDERHKELRLVRMRAVQKLVRSENIRRHIWQFLDDLQGSVLDVFSELRTYKRSTFDPEMLKDLTAHRDRFQTLRAGIEEVERHLPMPLPEGHALAGQLAELGVRMTESMRTLTDCQERLVAAADGVCALAAVKRPSVEAARAALQHLQHLGDQAEKEMRVTRDHRASLRKLEAMKQIFSAPHQSTAKRPARRWPRVQTQQEVLLATSDPNLVRRLRRPLLAAEGAARVEAAGQRADPPAAAGTKTSLKEGSRASAGADLRHGGPAGVYRRDPSTGRWGARMDGLDGTAPTTRSQRRTLPSASGFGWVPRAGTQ